MTPPSNTCEDSHLDLQPSEKADFEAQSHDWALGSCCHDRMTQVQKSAQSHLQDQGLSL